MDDDRKFEVLCEIINVNFQNTQLIMWVAIFLQSILLGLILWRVWH